MMETLTPGLLVAMPTLLDPYFEKTVVLLCEYNTDGAFGLVINRPSNLQVKDIWLKKEDIKEDLSAPLLVGGPVQPEYLWAVHSAEFIGESSSRLAPNLYLSALHEVFMALNQGCGPEEYHLGCGYAGWGAGQLDNELKSNAWWLTGLDTDLILAQHYDDRWSAVLSSIGIDPITSSFTKRGEA